jgi:hypothetical protein
MQSLIKQIILNSPVPDNPNNIEILVHTAWTDEHDPIRVLIEVEDEEERVDFFHQISEVVFKKYYTRYTQGSLITEKLDD